jgi:diguanylate cyclase (GGDEF)-like protein
MKFKLNGWRLNALGGAQRGCDDLDALAGRANYRGLSETVESEIKRSKRGGREFAVLVFEVNGMNQIKDCLDGHLAGNRALCRLAHIFRSSCRSIDIAARYGDDKFAVILPMSGAKAADIVERRICERLATDREKPRLTVSVGIAVYPEDGETLDALFQVADPALYKIKEWGEEALGAFAPTEIDARTYPEADRITK